MGRWRWVVGCGGGLRGRARGFKAKGEGLSAGGSERRPCVGPEGSEGMCGIRAEGSEGITRGRGERRGARGGGRCVDLAPGGLERRASLPYHPGLGNPRQQGGVIIRQGDHRPQCARQVQGERFRADPGERYMGSPGQHLQGHFRRFALDAVAGTLRLLPERPPADRPLPVRVAPPGSRGTVSRGTARVPVGLAVLQAGAKHPASTFASRADASHQLDWASAGTKKLKGGGLRPGEPQASKGGLRPGLRPKQAGRKRAAKEVSGA